MVEKAEEYPIKTNFNIFKDRLVVKCMGKKQWIEKFCSYIVRIFPAGRITFSPIQPNKGRADYDYFCFINILMEEG